MFRFKEVEEIKVEEIKDDANKEREDKEICPIIKSNIGSDEADAIFSKLCELF